MKKNCNELFKQVGNFKDNFGIGPILKQFNLLTLGIIFKLFKFTDSRDNFGTGPILDRFHNYTFLRKVKVIPTK